MYQQLTTVCDQITRDLTHITYISQPLTLWQTTAFPVHRH